MWLGRRGPHEIQTLNRPPHPFRPLALVVLVGGVTLLAVLAGCRSTRGKNLPAGSVSWMEKPWDRERIEACAFLYVETEGGKQIVIPGPIVSEGEAGPYITKRDDDSRRVALSEVTEMGEFDHAMGEQALRGEESGPPKQALAASFLALWGAVLLFIPAVIAWIVLF